MLHVAAVDGPPQRHFAEAGIFELTLEAPGFATLVGTVRKGHGRVPALD